MYWEGNNRHSKTKDIGYISTDILRPNSFKEYPTEIYNLFLSLIDHDGKVIDLECGNGLMLKHLVTNSKYELISYGADFIKESIKQTKEIALPEYSDNFIVANVVEADLGENSFDFIFFDPYIVHPDDLENMVDKLLKACRSGVR